MSEHSPADPGKLQIAHPLPGYAEVRRRALRLSVRAEQVPTEHEVSLPLPTLRWGEPGYACYAGPAARTPAAPLRLGTPDRWWVVRATDLALVVYALVSAVPFSPELLTGPVGVPPSTRSMPEAREDHNLLNELMSTAIPPFFAGAHPSPALRTDLAAALGAVLPAETVPWARRLAPDFFAWLEGMHE